MLDRIQLLRNVGQFDSVATGAQLPLGRLALIYAENGRGKTTLAAILRSAATGDAAFVTERRRLGSQHPPHVVITRAAAVPVQFQNGAWSAPRPPIPQLVDVGLAEDLRCRVAVYRAQIA